MTNLSTVSRNRLLHHRLQQTGHTLKVGTIYSLLAIACIYGALLLVAIAILGAIATPVLSLMSLVLSPIGDSLSPRP